MRCFKIYQAFEGCRIQDRLFGPCAATIDQEWPQGCSYEIDGPVRP